MASAVKIDINTVTAEDLANAAGIRPHVAGAIVSYRHAHGRFVDLASVTEVPGVGATTYRRIRDVVADIGETPAEEPAAAAETAADKSEPVTPTTITANDETVEPEITVDPMTEAVDASRAPVEEDMPPSLTPERDSDEDRQEIVAFWIDLGREQLTHNLEAMKAMTTCRSLPEVIHIQQRYLHESYARMSRAFSHGATFAGAFMPKGIRLG